MAHCLGNASYGMEIRGLPKGAQAESAGTLAARRLGDFANEYPKALSHGMRQRCALARTLPCKRRFLVMSVWRSRRATKLQLERC